MKKNYSDLLKSPKWQKKRLEIMSRDKFTCKKCGDTESQLHVHHKEYIDGNDPWDYPDNLLITICYHCHFEIEETKKEYPDIDFKDFKLIKSNNWDNGSRIMFIKLPDSRIMRIYNNEGKLIAGFEFALKYELAKIFK